MRTYNVCINLFCAPFKTVTLILCNYNMWSLQVDHNNDEDNDDEEDDDDDNEHLHKFSVVFNPVLVSSSRKVELRSSLS